MHHMSTLLCRRIAQKMLAFVRPMPHMERRGVEGVKKENEQAQQQQRLYWSELDLTIFGTNEQNSQ